jgi:hypothetical protein
MDFSEACLFRIVLEPFESGVELFTPTESASEHSVQLLGDYW